MDPAQNPMNTGESIAQGLPGVGILMMLRKMGEQAPDSLQRALQMLGIGQQPPPINQPLPRHGGMDAQGNPIIIPPQWRTY